MLASAFRLASRTNRSGSEASDSGAGRGSGAGATESRLNTSPVITGSVVGTTSEAGGGGSAWPLISLSKLLRAFWTSRPTSNSNKGSSSAGAASVFSLLGSFWSSKPAPPASSDRSSGRLKADTSGILRSSRPSIGAGSVLTSAGRALAPAPQSRMRMQSTPAHPTQQRASRAAASGGRRTCWGGNGAYINRRLLSHGCQVVSILSKRRIWELSRMCVIEHMICLQASSTSSRVQGGLLVE